jgi:hypothetical protein
LHYFSGALETIDVKCWHGACSGTTGEHELTPEQSMDNTDAEPCGGELVELPIHCARCGGSLEVQCADWMSGGPSAASLFSCPYCRYTHRLTMPARLLWVSKWSARAGRAGH